MEKSATPEATQKYFQSAEVHSDKQRLFDGLTVSALGAGTYLGQADDATDRLYEQSLVKAAMSGINFFDTAINYRCMRSEKVLQRVLKELANQGVPRERIVISTKGGYLPCEGMPDGFDDYVRTHYLDPGIISSSEVVGGCHCMSPKYLDTQISLSLRNLGIDCIDLYYLHNPETQLQEIEEGEFYRRLCAAFELFEKKVQENKIKRYGIATWNGLRQKNGQKTTLQMSKILACAKEVGGDKHHFRAVQMPYNLVMLEAVKIKNQIKTAESDPKTALQTLAEQGVAFMVSSPFMQSHAMSLSSRVFDRLPKEETQVLQSLQFLASTPHVCTLFAGMKKLEHLQENRKILRLSNWPKADWEKSLADLGGPPSSPSRTAS